MMAYMDFRIKDDLWGQGTIFTWKEFEVNGLVIASILYVSKDQLDI